MMVDGGIGGSSLTAVLAANNSKAQEVVVILDSCMSGALGQVTVASIYAYVAEALGPWDQRPLFKAHVSKLVPLRTVQAVVPLATLRLLPHWFANPTALFPLDPSFEDTEEPRNTKNEETFKNLQTCRAAKLVDPVGEDHMYYAAMNSTGCQLTALGRRYWRIAQEDKL